MLTAPNRKPVDDDTERPLRIAYMMSRFPKLTETFILNEILAMKGLGETVEIYPLWREKTEKMHPTAEALLDEVHFLPHFSTRMLFDNLSMAVTRPTRYFRALRLLVFHNAKSPRFLMGAVAFFPQLASFARDIERRGIDHIHAHFASHPAAAAYGLGILTDIGWSFTAHGSDLHRRQTMLKEKVRHARFAVTISRYNREFMANHIDPDDLDKVHVVRCGVDPNRFRATEKAVGFRIICVGTLHEVKGQRFLIEACSKLQDIDWRCDIVGSGPDQTDLEALAAKLGVSDRIVFHGACTSERVAELMSKAHVACAPSVPTSDGRREGLPVVLMEAAASSLPLISSNLSGIPEIVQDRRNGFLTEPGDVDAIADALTTLAENPGMVADMGKESRAIAEKEFSLQTNTEKLRDLFRKPRPC